MMASTAASTSGDEGIASPSYRELGNSEYKAGNYLKAAALYTKGLKEEPSSAVLYRCLTSHCYV